MVSHIRVTVDYDVSMKGELYVIILDQILLMYLDRQLWLPKPELLRISHSDVDNLGISKSTQNWHPRQVSDVAYLYVSMNEYGIIS